MYLGKTYFVQGRGRAYALFVVPDVADRFLPRRPWVQQLPDNVVEAGDRVVELFDLAGEGGVGGEQVTHLYESTDDGDADVNSLLAFENAG